MSLLSLNARTEVRLIWSSQLAIGVSASSWSEELLRRSCCCLRHVIKQYVSCGGRFKVGVMSRGLLMSFTPLCRIAASEGNQTLRALCRAAHAACILIRDLMLSGNVCEVQPYHHASSLPCALIVLQHMFCQRLSCTPIFIRNMSLRDLSSCFTLVQEEDCVIHTFGIQAMINQRGSDVSSALDDIALAIDLLSAPDPAKDAHRAAGTAHFAPADVPALLCRLRLRECLLKVRECTFCSAH